MLIHSAKPGGSAVRIRPWGFPFNSKKIYKVRKSYFCMEIEFTRISSKGQVVIPLDVRKKLSLREGEPLAVSTKNDLIVLKKVKEKMSRKDMETLNGISEAWKDIEEGRCKKMNSGEFLAEIKKW